MSTPSADVLAILEATFDAVVIMDDRGRILAFNRSAVSGASVPRKKAA